MTDKKFDLVRGFSPVTKVAAVIASFFILMLMLYVTGDVIGRYAFLSPLPGAFELAVTFMAFIGFLGLAYGESIGIHIRLTTIHRRVGARGQAALNILCYSMGIFIFGLIVVQAWTWARESLIKGDYMEGMVRFPYYPSKFATAVGVTLLLIIFILRLVEQFRRLPKGGKANG